VLVTFLGHAQLFLNAANHTVLIDPWFAEPVFGGAWYRYPPPPYPNASTIPRPELLLLSHAHGDHSGEDTLRQLPTRTPTFAVKHIALERRLRRVGFENVTWCEPWKTLEPHPGLKLTFVPHDRGWEVASIVVEADGVRLYHGNDNTLSVEAYREVVERLGPIDLAFLPFAGASSYPTCFDWDRETIERKGREKKAEGIQRLLDGIEGLRPREAAPFASSWALLDESELWKNYLDRATPDEALKAAMPKAMELGTHLLLLEPGDQWTPETGPLPKHLTKGWPYSAEGVRRYAATQRDRVQARSRPEARLAVSHQEARAYLEAFAARLPAALSVHVGFVAKGTHDASWNLTCRPHHKPELREGLTGEEDEVLTLHEGELAGLVRNALTWEDLWYGYRLRVSKREGSGYLRAFWEALLSFELTQE
jgi:L-ascorbate metabolism protein UlaG (beta-lactamase superfamily)